MWKEWMSAVWPEGCWWPMSVEDGCEGDRGWAGWTVWRWPYSTEEWRWRLRDNARKIGKSGEPLYTYNWMIFTWQFLLGTVFFQTVLWWLSHGEGMDAVTWCGWDKLSKGCNYWKSRLRCQVYGLRGVSWWLCVCYLTWHDYPFLCIMRNSWYIILLLLHIISHDVLLSN